MAQDQISETNILYAGNRSAAHQAGQLNKRGRLISARPAVGNRLADQRHCPDFCCSSHQLVSLTPIVTENPVSDIEADALNSSSGSE